MLTTLLSSPPPGGVKRGYQCQVPGKLPGKLPGKSPRYHKFWRRKLAICLGIIGVEKNLGNFHNTQDSETIARLWRKGD